MQRANRANVSFYPIDPRGPGGVRRADRPGPAAGPGRRRRMRLTARQDGAARRWRPRPTARSCSTPTSSKALPRLLTDVGALLPAGLRLDQPEARRPLPPAHRAREAPGVEVRARPGLSGADGRRGVGGRTSRRLPRGRTTSSAVREALSRLPARTDAAADVPAGRRRRRAMCRSPSRSIGPRRRRPSGPRARRCASRSGRPTITAAERQVEDVTLEAGQARLRRAPTGARPAGAGPLQVRAQVDRPGRRVPLTLSTVATVPATTRCSARPPWPRAAVRAPAACSSPRPTAFPPHRTPGGRDAAASPPTPR